MISYIWILLAGVLFGVSFLGDIYVYGSLVGLFCIFMGWLSRSFKGKAKADRVELKDSKSTQFIQAISANNAPQTRQIEWIKENRKKNLLALEEVVDQTLLDCLNLLQSSLDAYSYCIFFPGRMNGMFLRTWISHSKSIIPGARIEGGQGLVGLLLKEGQNKVLESEIVASSTQLQYYSDDEKICSLAGMPIIVQGSRRGAIVVDSLEKSAFDSQTLEILKSAAHLVGHLMYYAYANFESNYQRDQLAALTSYQRKFFENMSVREIEVYLQQYIEQTLEADRITILAREPDQMGRAKVIFCKGIDERQLKGFTFDIQSRGLVNIVFEKDQVINRTIGKHERIPRLSPEEPYNESIQCVLAVPMRTDKGISHVIMVESCRRKWYTNHQKELLMTIGRAAGFAISRARMYEEKETLSRKDGLTGLINRKTFHEHFEKEFLRAQTLNYPICILMIDVDHFKKVNDNHGHPVGDVVLKEVSKNLVQYPSAEGDIVARYGGEEFICLLVNCDVRMGKSHSEKMRKAIESREFDIGRGQVLKVTCSIGGAVFPIDSRHGEDLLEKADQSLYHAKKTGRNKVVFYSD